MAEQRVNYEPLAFPDGSTPPRFVCQCCSQRVTREHINVWQRRSHDHIRARNTRTSQICDSCRPVQVAESDPRVPGQE